MMSTAVRQWSPVEAALLSFLIPGAAQMCKGKVISRLLWLFFVLAGYIALIVPGAICI